MMSVLHKNAVITGPFDSFCLLCELHLKDNLEDHIDVPQHKNNLKESSYIEKYKKHNILKVKNGYYCEFCNILVPTLLQVDKHVLTIDHDQNSGNGLLKQLAEGIIAFDRLYIDNGAWNGLVENSCLLCQEDFDDRSEHLKTASHVINLIQKEVQFREHEIMFRKVEDNLRQCLICNILFGIDDHEPHFKSKKHLENIESSCDLKKGLDIKYQQCEVNVKSNQNEDKHQLEIEKAKESDTVTTCVVQSEDNVKLNRKNRKKEKKASKRKEHKKEMEAKDESNIEKEVDGTDIIISSSLKCIENHVEESAHRTKLTAQQNDSCDLKKALDIKYQQCDVNVKSNQNEDKHQLEIEKAKESDTVITCVVQSEDNVKLNRKIRMKQMRASKRKEHKKEIEAKDESNIETDVISSMIFNCMENFFEGSAHKTKLTAQQNENESVVSKITKTPFPPENKIIVVRTDQFLKKVLEFGRHVTSRFVVLNYHICIEYLSLCMMTVNFDVIRCQACEVIVKPDEVETHRQRFRHSSAMSRTPFVVSLEDEFVRKFRNIYHCGYCNLMTGDWQDLTKHLLTSEHVSKKDFCRKVFIKMQENVVMLDG